MRGAWAGTRPAPTGPLRGKAGVGAGRGRETACGGRHCWLDTMLGKNTHGGETGRGVAGAQPLHKGGPKARPPRTAVVSGQWLVASWKLFARPIEVCELPVGERLGIHMGG